MQQIPNVQTQADYSNACTLGPDAFEAITANVWNFSALAQVHTAPPSGFQVGEWADEVLLPPGQYTLDRVGGVRFKTNPSTPTTPARIIAAGWRDAEPRLFGGVEYTTTLGGTGAVTASQMITGAITAGGTIIAGTGFNLTINGTGDWTVVFTVAFSSPPVFHPSVLNTFARRSFAMPTADWKAGSVRATLVDGAGSAVDSDWMFTATGIV